MSDDLAELALANHTKFEAWKSLVKVQRTLLASLEAELDTSQGIGLTAYDALDGLHAARDGRLRMHELAASVMLTPSGLTRLVDRMEADGIVTRESCPTDGRGSHVRITSKGISVLKRAETAYQAGIVRHLGTQFTDADALALKDACDRILADAGPEPTCQ
ncbi:MAG: MarR family winged helix-turn-helix transcriptional regulator [Acidimicrobiales bacterium]